MRYRKNPSTGKLESNTVVYKWSDGSTTISVGDQHYVLQEKPLAPPKDSKTYQEVQDSHSYIAAPSITNQILVTVGHMRNQYTVRPNKDVEDDALEKLQKSLEAAARAKKGDDKNGPRVITNTQDPELQKKRAELAEKERLKAVRRRETAAEKAILPRRPGGGLSVDDLEGRGGRRAPGSARKPPGAKRARRRPEYDSDDDLPRGRNREDEYDKEDDFLASSDEDLEEGVEGDDDEEEEMIDDDSDAEQPKAKKLKSSKPEETSDADAEADFDDDEVAAAPASGEQAAGGRGRKRNIIEEDDDE
jgi:RNA polymerase-associated protein LEO1